MPSEAPEAGPDLIVLTAIAVFLLFGVIRGAKHGQEVAATTYSVSTRLPACHYGSQAYYFEDTGAAYDKEPKVWRLRAFDSACQPRPLFGELMNVTGGENASDSDWAQGQLVIVLYGDSIDRNMFGSVCNHAGATTLAEPGPQPSQALRYVSTAWCSTPKFLLVHSWTNGMFPQQRHRVLTPEQAVNQSSTVLYTLTGGRPPDIIMFASCLWDLRGLHGGDGIKYHDGSRIPIPYLSEEKLQKYISNVRAYLTLLKNAYPGTKFWATHTTNIRNPRALLAYDQVGKSNQGGAAAMVLPKGHSQQLIVVGYMTTMNMALRYVATSEDLVLIDWEAIALMLPAAHLYVGDGTHPIGDLSAIVIMNLLLNEYERHSGGTATL